MPKASKPAEDEKRPSVPEGRVVYAVGDCHGRLDLLCALEEKIVDDAAARPADQRVIVYLGDYVDRGPDSAAVIDHLVSGPLAGFEAVHLLGNHEEMMLAFLSGAKERGLLWLLNGGEETLASYGVDPAVASEESDLEKLQIALAERLPDRHRRFLESLPLYHEEGDFLFVHAGLRPGISLEAQRREDLIWIREPFLESACDFGRVVVHGHTPSRCPVRRFNRIGIDTGAVYGGALTALVLEGAFERYLQV